MDRYRQFFLSLSAIGKNTGFRKWGGFHMVLRRSNSYNFYAGGTAENIVKNLTNWRLV